jgi:hypothetical protein
VLYKNDYLDAIKYLAANEADGIMNFSIKSWDSCSELDERLRIQEESGFTTIKLGRNCDGMSYYYSILDPKSQVVIGIYSPCILYEGSILQDSRQNFLIGCSNWICWIYPQDNFRYILEEYLVFVFYEFIDLQEDAILVISEVDILKINFDHEIFWHVSLDDVLVSFELLNKKFLKIALMEEPTQYKFIDIASGLEVNVNSEIVN